MSIVSAHQLHFFPWLPYMAKICAADIFVFADDVQFKTHNFINRCQIKTVQGPQWLTVPVLTKGMHGQLIKQVRLRDDRTWQRKMWKSICVNYQKAAFFEQFADELEKLFSKKWQFLFDLNWATMQFLLESFRIETPCCLSSELNLPAERTDRLVAMAQRTEADVYLSGPSGRKYMDFDKFTAQNIRLAYFRFQKQTYHQVFGEFVPNLSVLDLLLNEGPEGRKILQRGAQIEMGEG